MYKDGFAQIELKEDESILVTEHDAYGFTVLTNRAELQHEEALRSTLAEAFQQKAAIYITNSKEEDDA